MIHTVILWIVLICQIFIVVCSLWLLITRDKDASDKFGRILNLTIASMVIWLLTVH